jgi:exocyst complex component 4
MASEYRFVFEGLGTLMERVLISNSRQIGFANRFGVQKILRNVLALQQNLKTINDLPQHVDFERARRYWELFFLTPSVSIRRLYEHWSPG